MVPRGVHPTPSEFDMRYPTRPTLPHVLCKKTSHVEDFLRNTFCKKICKKDILQEGHFAQDFEKEESDSSISYVCIVCIQSSSIDQFESFDLVNFLESIDSIIQIDSSRYSLR